MFFRRSTTSSLLLGAPLLGAILGAVLAAPLAGVSANAGEYIYGGPAERVADHCARLGQGFVDVGNGICGRVSNHIRVGDGARTTAQNAAMNGWMGGGTSNAGMRTGGPSMVPGVTVTQHLRVRGNLDSYSPFR